MYVMNSKGDVRLPWLTPDHVLSHSTIMFLNYIHKAYKGTFNHLSSLSFILFFFSRHSYSFSVLYTVKLFWNICMKVVHVCLLNFQDLFFYYLQEKNNIKCTGSLHCTGSSISYFRWCFCFFFIFFPYTFFTAVVSVIQEWQSRKWQSDFTFHICICICIHIL